MSAVPLSLSCIFIDRSSHREERRNRREAGRGGGGRHLFISLEAGPGEARQPSVILPSHHTTSLSSPTTTHPHTQLTVKNGMAAAAAGKPFPPNSLFLLLCLPATMLLYSPYHPLPLMPYHLPCAARLPACTAFSPRARFHMLLWGGGPLEIRSDPCSTSVSLATCHAFPFPPSPSSFVLLLLFVVGTFVHFGRHGQAGKFWKSILLYSL